jgi:putative transposase
MTFDPSRHHRRSVRLHGYDYAQEGAYFVTVCIQGKACLFGEVVDGAMRLNEAGRMVEEWWNELKCKFPDREIDEYVVMPNHFHGIVIVGADLCVRPDVARQSKEGAHAGAPLPKIIQWFKTMTTNAYLHGIKGNGWPPFPGRLWQRNYYEHIIRDEASLDRIRQYVLDNPGRWADDPENPEKG